MRWLLKGRLKREKKPKLVRSPLVQIEMQRLKITKTVRYLQACKATTMAAVEFVPTAHYHKSQQLRLRVTNLILIRTPLTIVRKWSFCRCTLLFRCPSRRYSPRDQYLSSPPERRTLGHSVLAWSMRRPDELLRFWVPRRC